VGKDFAHREHLCGFSCKHKKMALKNTSIICIVRVALLFHCCFIQAQSAKVQIPDMFLFMTSFVLKLIFPNALQKLVVNHQLADMQRSQNTSCFQYPFSKRKG
jgi:hypothetical protein